MLAGGGVRLSAQPGGPSGAYSGSMRHLAVLVVVVLVATACGDEAPGPTLGAETTTTTLIAETPPASEADRIEVTALALRSLVTDYNTFGSGHRFTEVLVQNRIDPAAGGSDAGFRAPPGRALTDAERTAVERALGDLGPYRWIDDAAEFRTDDLRPVIEGSAIVGVGEVAFDADGALVPVSLWCGGTCGMWTHLRVVYQDGGWLVTGPEGPMMIS